MAVDSDPVTERPTDVVLQTRQIRKSFSETVALGGVDFRLRRGTVHALLGGNGSGKSTFIKALAGVQQADSGTFFVAGEEISADTMTPTRARLAGLHFVHQQMTAFGQLTVAENLLIGELATSLRRISWQDVTARAEQLLRRFHIDASPRDLMHTLNPAGQMMVVIARTLGSQETGDDCTLVLDEPTAALPANEAAQLLSHLRRCADNGQAIVYVTHRLGEVLEVADEATVLRDGLVAANLDKSEISHEALVESIMGRKVENALTRTGHRGTALAEPVSVVSGLSSGPLMDVSLEVRAGEICGIAGVVGSGRSSLLRAMFGDMPVSAGTHSVRGDLAKLDSPRSAMKAGVALIPEDRPGEALFSGMSVRENLGMCTTGDYFRGLRLRHRAERRDADVLMDRFRVKAPSLSAPVATLSGGNQQKVVLARWLRRGPALILLDEPTQGVDVGARAELWELVRQATQTGAAALVVSSDFEELARVCDRVLVMRGGRIHEELSGDDLDEERVTRLALEQER